MFYVQTSVFVQAKSFSEVFLTLHVSVRFGQTQVSKNDLQSTCFPVLITQQR